MRSTLLLLTAAAAVAAGGTSAEAAFIPLFSGTQMNNDVTLRYAVYQDTNTATPWRQDLSTNPSAQPNVGGGMLDARARFVYFYQLQNNSSVPGLPGNISSFSVALGGVMMPYTSAGFTEKPPAGNGVGFVDGAVRSQVTSQITDLSYTFNTRSFRGGGRTSEILFATSSLGPVFTTAQAGRVGGPGAIFAGIPTASSLSTIPEPGSMALFALFGLCGGGVTLRRRKAAAV